MNKSRIYEHANVFHFSYLTVHSQCLCTGGFKLPHHTCVNCTLDHETSCDVTNPVCNDFNEHSEHFQQMNVKTAF